MRKFFCYAVALSLFLAPLCVRAQNETFTRQAAATLVAKNFKSLGLSTSDLSNMLVTNAYYDKMSGAQIVYLQQTYKGVPIHNAIRTLVFKNDKTFAATAGFIAKPAARVASSATAASVSVSDAVQTAVGSNAQMRQSIPTLSQDGLQKYNFGKMGIAKENITAKQVWMPGKDGKLTLCWQVMYMPAGASQFWRINVDAIKNTIVSKDDLTVYDKWAKPSKLPEITDAWKQTAARGTSGTAAVTSATYRVIPFPAESMFFPNGTPALLTNPWEKAGTSNAATTLGWHNIGSVSHDSTRGNNVWAREDQAGNNGVPNPGHAAVSTTPSPALTFNFPFTATTQPITTDNRNFALTQLFYANNTMHDISYLYGFDEAAGNFQASNMSRGGEEGDFVIADGQDGSGTDNADFETPEDGTSPRMQMYLWNTNPLTINSPNSVKGPMDGLESDFSTNNKLVNVGPVSGSIVYYNVNANTACVALSGTPLAGKIALIDRGGTNCNFILKVKNAQNAGAIAVIVASSSDKDVTVMGGTDNSITIPAVMISYDDGNALKQVIDGGTTPTATLGGISLDGDLDNGIMAHEYTHGISTRLTGGAANSGCLDNAEQGGEGWSDFFALMTTTDWSTAKVTDGSKSRSLGTYVFGEQPTGAGIRIYPYSTDKTIDPWTYGMMATGTEDGEPHDIGEIWATTLWDMTWNLIQIDGINTNIYNPDGKGGNTVALKLVTEGLKLQSCLPGFLDARDAILKADTLLYSGKYSCAIWKAFAGRGMGLNASQGSSNLYDDQTEDYAANTAIVRKSVDKATAAQGEQLTYTLTALCNCGPIQNYTITDTLADNVTWVSGGSYNSSNRVVTFTVPTLSSTQSQSFTLKVNVNSNTYYKTDTLLNEAFPTSTLPSRWTSTSTVSSRFAISSTRSHSSPYSVRANDLSSASSQVLQSSYYRVKGLSTLSFWHYYNLEEGYDAGTVKISGDSGKTWIDAGLLMTKNSYNDAIGFTGASSNFIQTTINLSSFANKNILIRFILTTDDGGGGDSWYLDDIVLTNNAAVYNAGKLYSGSALQSTSDTITVISNTTLPLVWGDFTTEKKDNAGLLKWNTEQEHNTSKFIIERSPDGTLFQPIATVAAAGESAFPVSYSYTDAIPLSGINYYRLVEVDKDGNITYSPVRSLSFDQLKTSIAVTPNPAKGKIAITIAGNTQTLQAALLTSGGQSVDQFIISGQYTQHALRNIAPGVYYLKITGNGNTITKKLVIQ